MRLLIVTLPLDAISLFSAIFYKAGCHVAIRQHYVSKQEPRTVTYSLNFCDGYGRRVTLRPKSAHFPSSLFLHPHSRIWLLRFSLI